MMRAGLKLVALWSLAAALGSGSAIAGDKREVVWDGFSFQAEQGQTEKCPENVHPSCKLLNSESYDERFATKLAAIEDDKYQFVNKAETDKGETLHLTITVNFEWADIQPISSLNGLRPTTLVGRYQMCSTLMLYSATASNYQIENAKSNCYLKPIFLKDLDRQGVKASFIADFINGADSEKQVNVEQNWLAEASQIIARRRGIHKSINVASVALDDSIYSGDEFRRERLKLFIAEHLSYQLSNAFGKPIIPPGLSGRGAMALSFRDPSRNREIKLWPAAYSLAVNVAPFQKKVIEERPGLPFETFFSIVGLTCESASKEKVLDGAGLYFVSRRALLTQAPKMSPEEELSEAIAKNQIPLENLGSLLAKIAAQIKAPDKKWVESRVYKTDPAVVFNGFGKIYSALKD
jgi:hypothetical protein